MNVLTSINPLGNKGKGDMMADYVKNLAKTLVSINLHKEGQAQ